VPRRRKPQTASWAGRSEASREQDQLSRTLRKRADAWLERTGLLRPDDALAIFRQLQARRRAREARAR
jgi:hypothetical protein